MTFSFLRVIPHWQVGGFFHSGRKRPSGRRELLAASAFDVQPLEPRLALAFADTVSPVVKSVTSPRPQTYAAASTLSFTVNFTEKVIVTGFPTLPVAIGETVRQAAWNGRGSGGNSLVFTTTVQPGDAAPAGVRIAGQLGLSNGAAIRDAAGNGVKPAATGTFPRARVDAVGPSATKFDAATVTPRVVSMRVTFSEPVVVKGKPSIPFTLAGTPKQLAYAAGSGRNVLTFMYRPAKGEATTAANVDVPTQAIRLNGGTITDTLRNAASSLSIPNDVTPVVVECVVVGDAGNAADTNPAGYGAVDYEYRIGKYKITIGQYATFLNAVAKSDPHGLYSTSMGSNSGTAGISRSGDSGSYRYSVKNNGTRTAITNVIWFDAARFANWISNGQPIGPQGPTTTENGAYALNGSTSGTAPAANAVNPNTGSSPLFRIPTENEWYKAAYYKGGGTDAGYWNYATQSDSPVREQSSSAATLHAATSTIGPLGWRMAGLPWTEETLPDSPSAYGTFSQSGDVSEWNDLDGSAGTSRGRRGGSSYIFDYGVHFRSSSDRSIDDLSMGAFSPRQDTLTRATTSVGFRLASPIVVP